jgi:Mlc titration factor MtfA (ptsG expression regulator)
MLESNWSKVRSASFGIVMKRKSIKKSSINLFKLKELQQQQQQQMREAASKIIQQSERGKSRRITAKRPALLRKALVFALLPITKTNTRTYHGFSECVRCRVGQR